MKAFTKAIALCCALVLLFSLAPTGVSAAPGGELLITNPYAGVDWDTWGSYKTQLHCHTIASDGYLKIDESVQGHYDLDYDIVAITDHGTINRGWDNVPQTVPLMRLIKKERTGMQDIVPLSAEQYSSYLNGSAPSAKRTRANGMLDVPKGIELNLATPVCDCHLTGYFSDYGQGLAGVYGDYETPSKGVAEAGGISMLSHVGEYVYPDKDSADHVGKKVDEYFVNKFARIFLDNKGSSLGMGINSAIDAHTRCDRILYDQVLAKTIPNGVTPWCFTFSDSHNLSSLNEAYTYTVMESFTLESFRDSMQKGRLFAVSHYSNGVELDGIAEMPEGYTHEEFDDPNNTPLVTRIDVDEQANTITVSGINFNRIVWVSNGNVIRREADITDGTATIDLDDYPSAELYVRFYITGDEGICYSQPFVLNREGSSFAPVEVPETRDLPRFLRGLVTVVDIIFFKLSPVIWAFKVFAMGYTPGDLF